MKADFKATHVARELAHDAPLINCRFHPAGRFLFATAEDRSVIRWDLDSAEEEKGKVLMQGHDSWVRGIAFSKDGETVLTSGYDDTLIWWPALADKPGPSKKVKAHEGWIRSLSVSPDGTLLASAGNDRVVKIWKMADGTLVRELEGHERDVYSTFFHETGEFVLSGDLLGKVKQWEVKSGKEMRSFDAGALSTNDTKQKVVYGGVRSLAMSADAKQLICSGLHKATNPLGAINEPLVLRWDWETQEVIRSHVAKGVRGVAWRARYHPEGFIIGCSGGGGGGYLLFWNDQSDEAVHQFKLKDTAREFDLHPDGIQVATVHWDKKLRISRMAAAEKK